MRYAVKRITLSIRMLNKTNNWLNIIIGVAVGIFIGNGAYVFFDYLNRLNLYAVQSTQ